MGACGEWVGWLCKGTRLKRGKADDCEGPPLCRLTVAIVECSQSQRKYPGDAMLLNSSNRVGDRVGLGAFLGFLVWNLENVLCKHRPLQSPHR